MTFNRIAIILFFISLISIFFSIFVFITPSYFSTYNSNLNQVNNIVSYTSLIFSAGALLVASMAFYFSVTGPNLKLKILPYQALEEGPVITLEDVNHVSMTRPQNEWILELTNHGKVSAINPLVKIEFNGMFFDDKKMNGWTPVDHANAFGWYSFQWLPSQNESSLIHVGFKTKIPTLYLQGKYVENAEKLKIRIIIAADKMKTKKYVLPVKVVR